MRRVEPNCIPHTTSSTFTFQTTFQHDHCDCLPQHWATTGSLAGWPLAPTASWFGCGVTHDPAMPPLPEACAVDLVFARFLHRLDDQNWKWSLRGFQLQAQFLNGREKRRKRIRGRFCGWWSSTSRRECARQIFGSPCQFEIKQSFEVRLIDHGPADLILQRSQQRCDRLGGALERCARRGHADNQAASR